MATKQVSVRLAAVGGKQVKAELIDIGQAGSKSLQQIDRTARVSGGGLQNFGFQVQDVAVQIAGGTSATRALAQQLPQLLSGFGLFGVALGTASAVLIPLVGYLFQAGEATQSWADDLETTSGSISSVESAVSALEAVQRQYVDAINAQGGASSAAAALVIANSAKEFAARKQLLAVEIELLRIRGQEQAQAAKNLSDGIKARAEASVRTVDPRQLGLGGTDRAGGTLGDYVNLGPRNLNELGLGDGFSKSVERDQLALKKLNAEVDLTNLTLDKTTKLLDTTFETVGAGGAGAPAGSGKGRAKGGGAARALQDIQEKARGASKEAESLNSAFKSTFESIITGSESVADAFSKLFASIASNLANSAFDGLSKAIFGDAGIGGFFSNIFGGGKAGGGPVLAGRSYMVGENGPEMVTMAGNGYVTNTAALRSAVKSGGGGIVLNVDARGAVEGVAAQVRREVQGLVPSIVQASIQGNRSATARGRA